MESSSSSQRGADLLVEGPPLAGSCTGCFSVSSRLHFNEEPSSLPCGSLGVLIARGWNFSGSSDLLHVHVCMCMEEGQGAVSSMSTTLWFVKECEGAGDWEGGAGG